MNRVLNLLILMLVLLVSEALTGEKSICSWRNLGPFIPIASFWIPCCLSGHVPVLPNIIYLISVEVRMLSGVSAIRMNSCVQSIVHPGTVSIRRNLLIPLCSNCVVTTPLLLSLLLSTPNQRRFYWPVLPPTPALLCWAALCRTVKRRQLPTSRA